MQSINTNVGAMVALQNLNATSSDLMKTQDRISTGLKVATAKDNGAAYAIAQTQRSTVASLDAVKDSISRGVSVVDVAMSAGSSISDMLTQLKEKALGASDTSLDSTSRKAMQTDFNSIRDQIGKTLKNASFNGVNLLDDSTKKIETLASADGKNAITITGQNLSLGSAIITLSSGDTFTTATTANDLLSKIDDSISNVSASLAKLGTSSKALDNHLNFVGKLQDSITQGIGNLVDADMAKESAKLQALQTKQQLGVQALSIANQSTSIALSLFR